jgi:hypothetical protein
VEGLDLGAAPGREGRMLLHAMGVKAVDPEDRVIDTIADAVGPHVFGKLHGPAKAERAQGCIIESSGTGHVCDADACVVDHTNMPPLVGRRCFRPEQPGPPR